MDDDEERLVVLRPIGDRLLEREELVELEITRYVIGIFWILR